MRWIKCRFCLPVVLGLFAIGCHVYTPGETLDRVLRQTVLIPPESDLDQFPAPLDRISKGINFPAQMLDYPLLNVDREIYSHKGKDTYVSFHLRDIVFYVGVVLLWYFIGRALDRALEQSSAINRSRAARIAGLAGGVVFGTLNWAYADLMMEPAWGVQRQIGACGIAWACILIAWFSWQLARTLGAGRNAKRALLAATVALFAAAVLWVGGPYGATQALGEYLRPTRVIMRHIVAECGTNESAPAGVLQLVESQRQRLGLTLQKVTVCRDNLMRLPLPPGGVDCMEHPGVGYRTAWAKADSGLRSQSVSAALRLCDPGGGRERPRS